MGESIPSNESSLKKRRTSRVVQAVPLSVSGIDALGRPFQERTSTLFINCHGCRYKSKHYVLKDQWVTLEVPHPQTGKEPRIARALVTSIDRPKNARELFQVGVELEIPGNVWGIAFPPDDWFPYPEIAAEEELVLEPTADLPAQNAAENVAPPAMAQSAPPEPVSVASSREDNIRVMPGPSTEEAAVLILARQAGKIVTEARQQLQNAAREVTATTVAAEARPMLLAYQTEFKEAIERDLLAKLDDARESGAAALHEELSREVARRVQESLQEVSAMLQKQELARQATFQESMEATLQKALARLKQLDTEARESAEAASRSRQEREEARATKAVKRLEELIRTAERTTVEASAATSTVHSGWRERLEKDLAAAETRWKEKMESSIENTARKMAEHLETRSQAATRQLEQELSKRAMALSKQFEKASADAENNLGTLCTALDAETARARVSLDEINEASNRIEQSAARFDAMSKAATDELKWYEKKLQMEMQTALDKGIEQATNTLHDKAGEISGKFAAQLDHYSRSYVEHTQAQLEEAAKEAFNRSRTQLTQTAETAAGEIGALIQKNVQTEFENFRGSVATVFEQIIQLHAPQLRARFEAESGAFLTDLRKALGEEVQQTLTVAQHGLEEQMSLFQDSLRNAGEAQHRQLQQGLAQADGEMVEAYKQRLENVSNSWLVTTVAMLNQRSEEKIAALATVAEERLRETCSGVFNSVTDAMRQRLLDLSAGLPVSFPPKDKS